MESSEVSRTQQVAESAEQQLEESANKVRMLSSDLEAAQEEAAAAAMKAHTAQLQLSAHDQLMFTARQKVDALSAQMVSVQADLASAQQTFTLYNSTQHLEQQAKFNYEEPPPSPYQNAIPKASPYGPPPQFLPPNMAVNNRQY
jgi:chromosome segregation ATPase